MTRWAGAGRLVGTTGRRLVKELSAFGVVGLACFVLDVGLFQLLYTQVGVGAVTSKLVATLVSMTAAYLGHRYWSFSHRARTGHRREYTLFAAVNAFTLLLGLAIVATVRHPLGQDSALVLQLANIASIALGTGIRFVCYRRWVFPAHHPAHHPAHQSDPGVPAPAAAPSVGPPARHGGPAPAQV